MIECLKEDLKECCGVLSSLVIEQIHKEGKMTAKTHMVVDLDRQIQELKSAVRKAGEARSSTAKEDFKQNKLR